MSKKYGDFFRHKSIEKKPEVHIYEFIYATSVIIVIYQFSFINRKYQMLQLLYFFFTHR